MSQTLRTWWVALTLAAMLLFLAWASPGFFTRANLLPLLTTQAPVLLVSSAAALVILTRQIDISLGAQFSWCSVLGALAAAHGASSLVVAAAALAGGALLGALNGFFVAALGLPSIVVSIAALVILRDGMAWWRHGQPVSDLPGNFQWLGLSQATGQYVIIAAVGVIFVLLALGMRFVAAGGFIYATGSDHQAARLAGLRPRWITFWAFTLSGALTGLAAWLDSARFSQVSTTAGLGLEIQAIAAAVVGGIAISGGRGSLWGVLAGVLLLSTISPALVFLHVAAEWSLAIQGAAILAAVAAEARRK